MPRLPGLLLLIVLLAAGCASPESPPTPAAQAPGAEISPEDYALENATIPRQELETAKLGEDHVHDLWEGREQLVLLDATAEAGSCEGLMDAAFYAFVTAFDGQGAAYGCVRIALPEGTVVPEGTGDLVVEADAGESLKSGTMAFQWRNKARESESEPTSDPKAVWSIPLTSADWDPPHAPATTFVMYVAARGPVGVLEGPIRLLVTAHRLPGWEPVLAVAHVDHWKLDSMHDFPAPGVMRLLDAEASVTNFDPNRLFGQNRPEDLELEDIIPPGTTHLTLVVDRLSTDCAPTLQCRMVPNLIVGGYQRQLYGTLLHTEGERQVWEWRVPAEAPEDSVYANASTTRIQPRITACVEPVGEASCDWASIASGSVTSRILALAWKGDVDLAVLKAVADGKSG